MGEKLLMLQLLLLECSVDTTKDLSHCVLQSHVHELMLGAAEIVYMSLTRLYPFRLYSANCLHSKALFPDQLESVCAADALEAIIRLLFSGCEWLSSQKV